MYDLSKFNERLSELIFSREITTNKLGEEIGVNGSTIRRWLEGKRNIRLKNSIKLCEYFNCSLEFLIGRAEEVINFIPHPALNFYARLIELMKTKGITRYRICVDLKKSHKHFDQWKTGSDPFLQTIIDLADYFEVSLDYFVGRER